MGVREAEVAAVEVEVFVDGERAVEGVELRHHADEPPRLGRVLDHVDAGDADGAAGGQGARGGYGDGGGFAGAVGAQKAKDFSLLQLQVDAVDGDDAEFGVIDLGQRFDFDNHGIHSGRAGKLLRAFSENLVGQVVVHFGFVVEHLEVGVFEQLRMAVAESLADGLLHARVVQFALPGRLSGDQLVDGVTDGAATGAAPS